MTGEQGRGDRAAKLISDLPSLVAPYDQVTPFAQTGQMGLYRRTLAIRREHATVIGAIDNRRFTESLYTTLQSQGIGKRASVLVPTLSRNTQALLSSRHRRHERLAQVNPKRFSASQHSL
jgi:hypothetical protein